MFWLLPLIGAALAVTVVTLGMPEIRDWFRSAKTDKHTMAALIKERMASGNVKVIGGVFDNNQECLVTKSWEASDLDEGLRDTFGDKDEIFFELS